MTASNANNGLGRIKSILSQEFSESVVETFINYCHEEQYEEGNIEEDIEEAKDSIIYEYMQSELQWSDKKTNQFIKILKNVINHNNNNNNNNNNDDDESSSISLTGVYSNDYPEDEWKENDDPASINNIESKISTELQSISDQLLIAYKPEIIKIFSNFCQEQEYLEKINILEDIEEDDDSFIIEHMQSECNWNKKQCNSFIDNLYKIITGNNRNSDNAKDVMPELERINQKKPSPFNHPPPPPSPPLCTSHHCNCSAYQDYRQNIHKSFGSSPLFLHALLFDRNFLTSLMKDARNGHISRSTSVDSHHHHTFINKTNNTNNNNNNHYNNNHSYKQQPIKQAMAKHNYSMTNSKNGFVIQSPSKASKTSKPSNLSTTSTASKSTSCLHNKSNDESIFESNDDIKSNNDPIKDYTNIDIETRARISLRAKMRKQCQNGTFYQNTKHLIPQTMTPPFLDDFGDFGDDDDDWKTADDQSWAPSFFDDSFGNNNFNKNVDDMVGLRNIGATCYMNSVLQALNLSDMYRDFLLNKVVELRYDPKYAKKYRMPNQSINEIQNQYSRQQQATVALKNLLRELNDKKKRVTHTQLFVKKLPKRWRPGKQQDSNEFAKFVLNCVWETIDQSAIMKNIYDKTEFGTAEKYQLQHLRLDPYSHGMLNYTTKCLKCNSKSAKFEAFFDLSLALSNYCRSKISKITTKQLINDHMKAEDLSVDNSYFCNKCREKVKAKRFISIVRPPKLLLICFKRYQLNSRTQLREKIMLSVDCPLLLQIDRDIQDSQNNEVVPYILYAVVVHTGSNAQFGHYYTIGRHSNDAIKCYKNNCLDGGNWYKFNDERICKSSYKHLSSLCVPDTPYMLFYLRVE